jgi:hypothetical protein
MSKGVAIFVYAVVIIITLMMIKIDRTRKGTTATVRVMSYASWGLVLGFSPSCFFDLSELVNEFVQISFRCKS